MRTAGAVDGDRLVVAALYGRCDSRPRRVRETNGADGVDLPLTSYEMPQAKLAPPTSGASAREATTSNRPICATGAFL
jgi:hypothetical protein